jgi:membrane protein YdbS with pleckstrin-like domain
METLTYPYKPKALSMLLAILFFAACFVVGVHVATTNTTEQTIVLGWRLEPSEARVLFGAVAVISVLFVAADTAGLIASFSSSRYLTLTTQEISLPKSALFNSKTTVPLHEIQRVDLQTVRNKRFLYVYHLNGRFTVTEGFLPNREAFERIRTSLAEHAQKR